MKNFKFYEVGGKVRDELLGLESKDIDYVAVPDDEFRMDIPAMGMYLCSGKSSAVSVQITYKDEQYILTGGKVYTALHSMRISQIPFIN